MQYTGVGCFTSIFQFFLKLMKVRRPKSESRLAQFEIQFNSQVSDLVKSLNTVTAACEETRNSASLKGFLVAVLYLGHRVKPETKLRFTLDNLLKLMDEGTSRNKMKLVHYICKVLAVRKPNYLDFHQDLVSLEAASKIELKSLAEEQQTIIKGLEKVKLDLAASENGGLGSETFCKTLKKFVSIAESEVSSVTILYSVARKNTDALILYFGEDPASYPFEQVMASLLKLVKILQKAQEENCEQAELKKKKA